MDSQSMPKYAGMLGEGMQKKGHEVEYWTARPRFYKIPGPAILKKWFGYIDQFIIFPFSIKLRLRKLSANTLFVMADQALGSWVPYIKDRAVVIHCHDFLAQRSAQDEFPENKVKLMGKLYQKMIRNGYRKGKNFISISENTRNDLHLFLNKQPQVSEVVYNGLNQQFEPGCALKARERLSKELKKKLDEGYVLHVGGNQFYKNRKAVLEIYLEWCKTSKKKIPLVMVGPRTDELNILLENSYFQNRVLFVETASNRQIRDFYQGALVLLYPSIAEGFGWPIAEAMASGCPVITTNKAPMNEVGGEFCNYLPYVDSFKNEQEWAVTSAIKLDKLINLPEAEKQKMIEAGIRNAKRFDTQTSIQNIERIYERVLQNYIRLHTK